MSRARITLLAIALIAVIVAVVVALTHHTPSDAGGDHADASQDSSATARPTAGNGATGFADPTTDIFGRKVAVPNNPAGQTLPQHEPGQRVECAGGQTITSPEQVTIETSFLMPILVTSTDGPARLDNTVLSGYRHSPQGAALAGWNFLARTYAGGAPAAAALESSTALDDSDRASLRNNPTPTADPKADPFRKAIAAPDAFRILTCDQDFAAVEWAIRLGASDTTTPLPDGGRWIGARLNLLWRDNDWKVQIVSDANALASGQRYTSLDGWTRWAF